MDIEERPTEGMPDMMPKGTVANPPQKEPQNIPERMVDEPYVENEQSSDVENAGESFDSKSPDCGC